MKRIKQITINAADPSNPRKDPVLPVITDFIDTRSTNPKNVLPTNIYFKITKL